MRLTPMPLALLVFAATGCASTVGSPGQERMVVAVDAAPHVSVTEPDEMKLTEPPVMVEAPPPPRRRLSQTVTLGQGNSEGFSPSPQASQQGGAGGPSVVVNNNVTVVNQPPAFYGGYGYGYGYGGYGGSSYGRGGSSGGSYGAGSGDGRSGSGGGSSSRGAWAPTGWEGAQRTAAPGRTPIVGGNYPAAPSSGPAPMK